MEHQWISQKQIHKTSQQNNFKKITNKDSKEIPKERCIYLQKRDKKLLITMILV